MKLHIGQFFYVKIIFLGRMYDGNLISPFLSACLQRSRNEKQI